MHIAIHVVSQPMHLITAPEMSAPTVEAISYFGKDAVVSLGDYFLKQNQKKEIDYFTYNAQLQLKHTQYQEVGDLLDISTKWQSVIGKS